MNEPPSLTPQAAPSERAESLEEGPLPLETPSSLFLRTGIDLASIEEVAASVAQLGDRYLRRTYTGHELESCAGPKGLATASLAARFAAKEATIKALALSEGVDYREIEVHRLDSGACEIRLSSRLRAIATGMGISSIAVSLTHEGVFASAVVVALGAPEGMPRQSAGREN